MEPIFLQGKNENVLNSPAGGHPTDGFGKLTVRKAFISSPIFLEELSCRNFAIWEILMPVVLALIKKKI